MTPEDSAQIEAIITASEQRHTAAVIVAIAASDERAVERGRGLQTEILSAIAERVRDLQTEMLSAIAASEERAVERARDLQTEVLRGLEAFARGNFARFHSVESNQGDINIRMAALEERVLYLETRRPPQ